MPLRGTFAALDADEGGDGVWVTVMMWMHQTHIPGNVKGGLQREETIIEEGRKASQTMCDGGILLIPEGGKMAEWTTAGG